MAKHCEVEDSVPGVFKVKVQIGRLLNNGSSEFVCNWKNQNDVKHLVKVTSLTLYPLEVERNGTIPASIKKVKFSPSGPNDTEAFWNASTLILMPGGWGKSAFYTFDHITLLKVARGTEIIKTDIKGNRVGAPGRKELSITATVVVEEIPP